jgi:hypothetical protein
MSVNERRDEVEREGTKGKTVRAERKKKRGMRK